MAELERRLYVPVQYHPSIRFDIYTDGLVIMYVYGVEVARKKVAGTTMDYQVYDAFAQELQAHGYSMGGPLTAVGGIQEKLQEVSEKVEKLEKEVKRLRRKR